MAKITVAGSACVITSAIKLEDIKLLAKYRPDALNLYEEKDGKKILDFSICATEKAGHISEFGISFNAEANDGSGCAQITGSVPTGDGTVSERVAEAVGPAVLKLNKLEEALPIVIAELKAERQLMIDSVEVLS